MSSSQPRPSSTPAAPNASPETPCKHLRVAIVARDQDMEFVECKECGEVFEASEFKDMAAEELIRRDQA